MKYIKKLIETLKSVADLPRGSRMDEYISLRRPKNLADLEKIIQEYNEMRMW